METGISSTLIGGGGGGGALITGILECVFLGQALWADSVSPEMNTIASRDQFKRIRIGENLVVNYKG